MTFLLPAVRYDDIRRAVDPMLDDEAIPDEVIESAVYLGAAERWAMGLDLLALSRTGVEQDYLFLGIIYYTAALLSPTVPQPKQVNMAGHNATFSYGETVAERTARLFGMAPGMIALYLPNVIVVEDDMPIFVTTVSGRRA